VFCGALPVKRRLDAAIGCAFEAAGHDHVYLLQVGPDHQGFLDFYAGVILPELK